jgi:hypothetical protein
MKTHTNQKKNRLTTAVSAGTLAATLIALGSLTGGANAAVTTIPVITSGTGAAGNIAITLPPINFTATSNYSGGFLMMVFDEAQPNAGGQSGFVGGATLGGGAINFYYDSGYFAAKDITRNDPYVITFGAAAFASGDTVSFSGGTVSQTSTASFLDVFASGSYGVFLADDTGRKVSAFGVAVPEPTSAILLGFGALGIVARRRRIK